MQMTQKKQTLFCVNLRHLCYLRSEYFFGQFLFIRNVEYVPLSLG